MAVPIRTLTHESEYAGKSAVLALGMFDGVHIGHRALISRAAEIARETGADCVVCTFDRHPRSVIFPGSEPAPLTTTQEQLAIFSELGADAALIKPFTRELAGVEAGEFMESLVRHTRATALVCGRDYSFGRGGRGDPELLARMASGFGFRLEVLDYVMDEGDVVSSTLIRSLIARGDTRRAMKLLGRR